MIDKTASVIISKANEVFLRVNAEPHIEYELRDHFTFQVEGAKFMPQYRNRTGMVKYIYLISDQKGFMLGC